ncbi:MAG: GNAT family N-acetyltransferase [Bacteroidota bacterium]
MQPITPPISKELLLKELNKDRFVRTTNYGDNEIYIVTHHDSPNVMKEIGRLREESFRDAGGGTGKEIDIDDFDTTPNMPYKQLIVWDPIENEIIGGYRYIKCKDVPFDKDGNPQLATTEILTFSKKFIAEYIPYTVELGRSFVQPKYQPSKNRKGLFSLDNLWDGLGAVVVDNPDVKYFYGKVTMYTDFNKEARDLILFFMNFYFPDADKLVVPKNPLKLEGDSAKMESFFKGLDYKEGFKVLNAKVRELGENIPPLVNQYMNLSPTMKMFGTAVNDHFGDVEETGILVTIADIYESKKERHIISYKK